MPSHLETLLQNPPLPLSIGLALTQPSAESPGIEVAGGGYSRRLVNFVVPSDAPDDLTLAGSAETFEYPRATSFWGEVGWLTAWDLDGVYVGWGFVVDSVTEATPTIVRIDRGDVARVKAGDLVVTLGPQLPRPYNPGRYGRGPYGRGARYLNVTGTFQGAFLPADSPCPGAANWIMEALPS